MTEKPPSPLFEDWSPQMTVAECVGGSWSRPRRVACGALPVHPGAMALQFGQSVFEGCKAHWNGTDAARLFRIEDHYERFVVSCERMRMPVPPRELFLTSVEEQVKDAASWSSPFPSETLYIRPVFWGEDPHVMPIPSGRATFVVLTAPLRVFPDRSLVLYAEHELSRAAPGGLGCVKTAANYAHQYLPSERARRAGCDAVLWLDAASHTQIEEASTMNLFLVLGDQLVTPALRDTILPGITRRSLIALARERHGIEVAERAVELEEVASAAADGTLKEVFIASTALQVRPIARIVDGDRSIEFPDETPWTDRLRHDLVAIQRGEADDPWGWIHSVPVTREA
jgi:branched-chain amino acid aminotransferase